MKNLKYLLVCFVALASFSCSEEPILKTTGDDDDVIIIPPPKPKSAPTIPLDSIPG